MKCWRGALSIALVALVSASEVLKETLSEAQCKTVVKKVQESGKYTEESIQPICQQEVKSSKCDFFSEALALSSSHNDFDSKKFCKDITEAHFCSQTMDHVLSSAPVSDLAFGECMRTHDSKGQTYCLKFEKMLAYAVQNDDLDTMRACYMIEAYEDFGAAEKAPAAPEKSIPNAAEKPESPPAEPKKIPEAKIINGSHSELESVGAASKPTTTTTPKPGRIVGQSGIVVQPKPLESIGEGKANASHAVSSEPTESEPIVVEPEPVSNIAVAVQKTQTKKHLQMLHTKVVTPTTAVIRSPERVHKATSAATIPKLNQLVVSPTSSSQKPAAAVVLEKRSLATKQVPAKQVTTVTGTGSAHRAGLATVHLAVKQKKVGEVKTSSIGSKKSSKDGKQDSKNYGGFLSGFVL